MASHSWARFERVSELSPACSKLRVDDHRPGGRFRRDAAMVGRMLPSSRNSHWTSISRRRWPMPVNAGRSLCPRAVAAAVSTSAGRNLCLRTRLVRVSADRGPTPKGRSGWPRGCDAHCPEGLWVDLQSAWARQQAGGLWLVRGRAAVSVDPPSGVSEEALSGRVLLSPRPLAARLLPGWLRTTLSGVRARCRGVPVPEGSGGPTCSTAARGRRLRRW